MATLIHSSLGLKLFINSVSTTQIVLYQHLKVITNEKTQMHTTELQSGNNKPIITGPLVLVPEMWISFISLKADSYRTCRAHAVPLPCRAAKGLKCVFPIWFTQWGHVWFTLAMPRPCHPRPCHSSQGHGTAWPSRKRLLTNCPLSDSSGYHTEFHEVVIRPIQSQMQVASVKPNTVYHGRGKEW